MTREDRGRELLKSVQVGKHLKLCRLILGTGSNGGGGASNQTRLGSAAFEDLIRYACDRGVRCFDLAEDYGTNSYAGRALKGLPRESYQLITKMIIYLPEDKMRAVQVPIGKYLDDLQTDYIDLLQLHCMLNGNWPRVFAPLMDQFADLKARGVIRAHGVSCHDFGALKVAVSHPWVDVIHVRINPFGKHMDAEPGQVVPQVETACRNGKGIIAMKVFGNGELDAGQRAQSLAWVTGQASIHALTIGFQSKAELDSLLGRSE